MRRRNFITGIASSAVGAWGAKSQQAALPIVGFLGPASPEPYAHILTAFRGGLADGGYVEGRNVSIEYRWAHDRYAQLPALARELVAAHASAIVTASGTPTALAAKAATSNIPIVFVIGTDPTEVGLVKSFNRPGANITGVTLLTTAMAAKRLELLRDLLPNSAAIALLVNPQNQITKTIITDVQAAARKLSRRVLVFEVSNDKDFDKVFTSLAQQNVDALMTSDDPIFISQREKLIALVARAGLPAVYSNRDMAVAGGLMGYGTNYSNTFHEVGVYVARILGGTKPTDLPVLQPAKFELVINLKTAATLGLTINREFLLRADEVIE